MHSEALTGGLARPCSFLSALVRILVSSSPAAPADLPLATAKRSGEVSPSSTAAPRAACPCRRAMVGRGERRPGPFGLFNAAPVGRRRPLPTEKRLLCPDITCRACGLARGAFSPPGLWSVTEAAQASPAGQNRGPSARTALCPGRALPRPVLCPGRCFALAGALPRPVLFGLAHRKTPVFHPFAGVPGLFVRKGRLRSPGCCFWRGVSPAGAGLRRRPPRIPARGSRRGPRGCGRAFLQTGRSRSIIRAVQTEDADVGDAERKIETALCAAKKMASDQPPLTMRGSRYKIGKKTEKIRKKLQRKTLKYGYNF